MWVEGRCEAAYLAVGTGAGGVVALVAVAGHGCGFWDGIGFLSMLERLRRWILLRGGELGLCGSESGVRGKEEVLLRSGRF